VSWRRCRLDWLATEERGAVNPTEISADTVFHYSIPALDEIGDGRLESPDEIGSGKLLLSGGEVLISKLNPRLPRVLLAEAHDVPTLASTEFIALRPRPGVDERFLRYWLESEPLRQMLNGATMSVTRSQQRVRPEVVTKSWLTAPSIDEQHAIADYLDAETACIDALIAKRRRMIELLDEREQAIRDIWVNDQFSRWDSAAFRRQLSHIEQGWSPQCEAVPAEQGEWGVLKTSAVSKGVFLPDENKRLPEYVEPDERWRVRDGDLLVTRGSGSADMVGRAAVACTEGRKLLLSDLIYRLVPYSSDTEYLAEILQSRRLRGLIRACIRMDSGQTLKVRVNDLRELPVPLTPSTEQTRALVELHLRLARTLRVREMLHYQLQLLAEHRRALITAAVNGEIEIPGLAA
jgi:type I restriction enzyme S subunit